MPPTPVWPRVGLLVNPTSGRGRARALGVTLSEQLTGSGHQVHALVAPDSTTARRVAHAAVHDGQVDVLAVVGGDGTAHLGVNACAGTDVPLAILPAGTGNDNARQLGLGRGDVTQVAGLIGAGHSRPIDAGRSGTHPDRWWLGVLGGGFDTIVNARAARFRRIHGTPRYLAAVAAELPGFRGIRYAVQVDDERVDTTAMLVAVANGGAFGGGMRVCPDARMDDGLLDVMILHQIGRGEFLKVFPRVFSGSHVRHPAVQLLRGARVQLEAADVHTEADGEPFLPMPVDLHAVPGAVQVCAP